MEWRQCLYTHTLPKNNAKDYKCGLAGTPSALTCTAQRAEWLLFAPFNPLSINSRSQKIYNNTPTVP